MAEICYTEYALQKKAHLEKSLLNLMLLNRYNEISVADICREAAIPRRTFYHYYESKEDILDAVIEEMMRRCFLEVMLKLRSGIDKESFMRIFHFWEGDNRIKLNALIQNGLESRFMSWSLQFIRTEKLGLLSESGMEPKLMEIGLMVGVTSFFSLLFYWSRGNYQETPKQMAEYAVHMLPRAFSNLIDTRTDL